MTGLKILLVDDDLDFAESMAIFLEIKGHDVTVAYSGESGVIQALQGDFDLVLLDVKLPGMSGTEALIDIRRGKPDARVMIMTALGIEQMMTNVIESGALEILQKPLDLSKFSAALEKIKPRGVILVADDDPDFVDGVVLMLQQAGHTVLVARTSQEALETVPSQDIGVLILDLRMPLLSGFEVFMELQRQERAVPTVIVTGYAREEGAALDALAAMEVSDCIVKPFPPEALLAIVERLK